MRRTHPLAGGWSPERALWLELERVSGTYSWRCVNLDSTRAHQIPKESGVYLICASPPGSLATEISAYTVLYAGQVNSSKRGLRTRFLDHIQRPDPKLRLFLECFFPSVHFWFTLENEPSRINELESILIGTFNPPCNKIGAPGSSILIGRLGIPRRIGPSGPTQTA